ncbi:hypothetical protein MJM28_28025, partial [Salmonella enterica subsp. enterica serovar Montevideo]|nr:hypothetical protein [Salmonella enterica subsp. enterica serovar Montevideo]
ISMAEATGQTIATAEIVNSTQNVQQAIPRTIRGDAVMSLLGGLQKGLQQGKQEGQRLAALRIARSMLNDGFDRDTVLRVTGLAP